MDARDFYTKLKAERVQGYAIQTHIYIQAIFRVKFVNLRQLDNSLQTSMPKTLCF